MIDWSELSARFDILTAYVDLHRAHPAKFDANFKDRHQIHQLTGGSVKSLFDHPEYQGAYVEPASDEWMERTRRLSADAFGDEERAAEGSKSITDWRKTIELCLTNKTVTTEFILSWAQLGEYAGRVDELIATAENAQKELQRTIATGLSQDNRVRRCWYSHWLVSRDAHKSAETRQKAENELIDVCKKVVKLQIRPPDHLSFYSSDWFGRMLVDRLGKPLRNNTPGLGDVLLSSSFKRLGTKKLQAHYEDKLITAEHLPPLQEEGFVNNCNP